MRKIIKTVGDIERNISQYYNNEPAGCDLETTGLSALTSNIRTIQLAQTDTDTLVIDLKEIPYEVASKALKPILENPEKAIAYHNAKFDQNFLKHHLKLDPNRTFDSYLSSVLLEAGIRQQKGYHGLASVLKRYTDIDISKDEQSSDWSGELSQEQYDYAAKDAEVMLPLRLELIERLRRAGLMRCAQLEFETVLPIVWLELSGMYLDFNDWEKLSKSNEAMKDALADEICDMLSPFIPQGSLFGSGEINLNSPPQVQKYFRKFGVPMPESTKEEFLLPLEDDYPIIKKFLEYKGYAKAVSSFGEGWRDFVNPITGRIHSSFSQIGAATGRFSSYNPNMQQLPKENRFRNCFKAEEGRTLVSADFSQIELRILADFARDTNAIKAFSSGNDYHQEIAALIFHKPVEEVSQSERAIGKKCNFTITYGATAYKVSASIGCSLIEAELILKDYFAGIPNVDKWLRKQKRDVLQRPYARTASGRIGRFIFDPNDPKQRSQAQRNAANMPIQGTSADILKRSLRLFYDATRDIQDHVKLVNIVHDEIITEVDDPYIERVANDLTKSMQTAGREFLKEVEIKTDPSICKYWNKD